MQFSHYDEIWRDFPDLVPGVLYAEGITASAAVADRIAVFEARARARLDGISEGELPEVQAWRRTFAKMGLKPTQYRCASEALLRRFRKEGSLPPIHPLIDLCNALSLAFAIPIAVFDVARIADFLQVRPASGQEVYMTFSGEAEHPEAGEVVFADAAGRAHARRWTNRQSGESAVREQTRSVLIVAEALHEHAAEDVPQLVATLAEELARLWSCTPSRAILARHTPRFSF